MIWSYEKKFIILVLIFFFEMDSENQFCVSLLKTENEYLYDTSLEELTNEELFDMVNYHYLTTFNISKYIASGGKNINFERWSIEVANRFLNDQIDPNELKLEQWWLISIGFNVYELFTKYSDLLEKCNNILHVKLNIEARNLTLNDFKEIVPFTALGQDGEQYNTVLNEAILPWLHDMLVVSLRYQLMWNTRKYNIEKVFFQKLNVQCQSSNNT